MRESFFINQFGHLAPLSYAEEGDFVSRAILLKLVEKTKPTNKLNIWKNLLSPPMKLKLDTVTIYPYGCSDFYIKHQLPI